MPGHLLDTERLTLRELTESDADFIVELMNEPSYLRFIGDRGVRTAADARAYLLKGPMASYKRFGFGMYLVELKNEKTRIGICGLIKRDMLEDVDIGFAFLPEFRTQGYALESAAAVMRYGRDTVGLTRVVAIVTPDNDRSIGLLSKLGLRFERMITWPEDGAELKLYAAAL
jgi:RimJ/RimL family protein N-acetyltransferase